MLQTKQKLYGWLDRQLSGSVFTWQEILKMLFPFILDAISIFFIGMLITALISKNGESSVAAVSLVNPLVYLSVCIFNGVGSGGTVVVAQSTGTKDEIQIRRACGHVLTLTVVIGLFVIVPFIIFARPVIYFLYPSAEEIVLAKASQYFTGVSISVIPFTLYTAVFSVLRGLGESKKCLALSIIINVAYLLLSILFLNVLMMDIRGSVYALISARVIGAASAVLLLFVIKPPVKIRWKEILILNRELIGRVMKVSIPLSLEQLFASFGSVVAEVYMAKLETSALASHAVTNSLLGVLYAPATAAGSLAVTVVGRCIGAQQKKEARHYANVSVAIATILVALTAVTFYPAIPLLLKQYDPSPVVAANATRLLWMSFPIVLLFWPSSNTVPFSLRACNDTTFPSVYSLVVMWIVNIFLGYIFAIPVGMGLTGVWIATWLAWTIRAIGYNIRFRKLDWTT